MKINKQQKNLIVLFIGIFLFSFIIINWDQVSWIFNYQELQGLTYDFFNPYQDSPILVNADSSINSNNNTVLHGYSDANNSLVISSIGVNTPVVIGESTDNAVLTKDLDKGAVYYPGSVLPGQNGQIVILGHSAPPNWPPIKHDYIFTNISKLNTGDQIVLNFGNQNYTYRVINKVIIAEGQDIEPPVLAKDNNILTLISCWPPGKNYKRIAVQAQLIK